VLDLMAQGAAPTQAISDELSHQRPRDDKTHIEPGRKSLGLHASSTGQPAGKLPCSPISTARL